MPTDDERRACAQTLLVVPPVRWHDDLTILGGQTALEHLRSLIDTALADGGAGGTQMPPDGEGGRLVVLRADALSEFEGAPAAYDDDNARVEGTADFYSRLARKARRIPDDDETV